MRRLILTITAALVAAGVLAAATVPASATHRSGGEPKPNIVGTVIAASGAPGTFDTNAYDYDILREAVIAAGLAEALSSGTWTVFAPNDRAFMRLVTDLTGTPPASEAETFATVGAAAGDLLDDILLYHVVAGKALRPLEVILGGELTMANGGTVHVRGLRLVDADPDLRDPRLVPWAIDIKASNGVIHTINRVLIPINL